MTTMLMWLGILAAAFVLINVAWRYAARRIHIPCPAWLAGALENPITEAIEGPEMLLDRAGVQAGMHVADIGCGPGRVTLPAARRVGAAGSVTALDMQPAMLAILRERIARQDISNVTVIEGGAGEGLLPRAKFDRAFLVTVLGEIPDRPRALREIFDALRPGGILSVTEVLGDPHYQRVSTVRRLGAETGFTPAELHSGWLAFTLNLQKPPHN